MPNYCANVVCFKHNESEEIQKLLTAFEKNDLFNTFVPQPANIANWYEWAIDNWGTKWQPQFDDGAIIDEDTNSVTLGFDTAWSPPIAFYDKMLEKGWQIDATYFEPGMFFAGIYLNGEDDFYDNEDLKDNIPDELEEMYNISSYFDETDDQ